MADTANHLIPQQGKFRRALAAVCRFLEALEGTPFNYTLDRIERLEREVGRLKDELHQVRHSGAVDASVGQAVALHGARSETFSPSR